MRWAICGAIVRKIKNRGTPSYSCSRGFHVARAMHFVDEYVTEALLARLQRPDLADLFADPGDGEEAALARRRAPSWPTPARRSMAGTTPRPRAR